MKKDLILNSLINFLIPITLLYSGFVATSISSEGIFAVIYSLFILFVAYILNSVKSIEDQNSLSLKLNPAIFVIKLSIFSYLIFIFLSITNSFSV